MQKNLMLLGTASSVGKSAIACGFCRHFTRLGLRTAPFKALNLSSKAVQLPDGSEIGTAQALQAAACGIRPDPRMNPVLLKPAGGKTRCFLQGRERESYNALEYRQRNSEFRGEVWAAYRELADEYDFIVLEGSGSCCELNLLKSDIANLSMAKAAEAPALLVADMEKGGVFASVYGTLSLLPQEDKNRFIGIILNKFHGDPSLFLPEARQLEELTGVPLLGVLPYYPLHLPDEDGPTAVDQGLSELSGLDAQWDMLADLLEKYLDIPLLHKLLEM